MPSEEGRGRPIFDFLYHDEKRVGSLLAQFDSSFGVLGQIKKTQRFASRDTKAKRYGGTLGVKGALSGVREWRNESSESADDSNELVYDPLWRNAITLVSTMEKRDVSSSRSMEIGSIVRVRAAITVLDTDLFSPILADAKMMRTLMNKSVPAAKAITEGEAKLIVAILKGIPRSLQAYIQAESGELMWCTMRRESMVVRAEEIMLKHGMHVPGTWDVLGVRDTAPVPDDKPSKTPDVARLGQLGEALSKLVPIGREAMGRPSERLGITPILIYREIN